MAAYGKSKEDGQNPALVQAHPRAEAKAEALLEFAAHVGAEPADTVAIGDGANDLGMFAVAGVSIAFNAKPAVREAADFVIDGPRLDAALEFLNR